jgi:hypothetical protein
LFAYAIDLPSGANSIKLPDNDRIRVLAISVAEENPSVLAAQPLYDVLPPLSKGKPDFSLSTTTEKISLPQGTTGSITVTALPRNGFHDRITLAPAGVPAGVKATFQSDSISDKTVLTLAADATAQPGSSTITITGSSGAMVHSATLDVNVIGRKHASLPVDLSSWFNTHGIYSDGSTFAPSASLDGGGFAYSAQLLGATQTWNGVSFKLGPANGLDAVTGETVTLPTGRYLSLNLLATAVGGSQQNQPFTITYDDDSQSTFKQDLSDWYAPSNFTGEFDAVSMPYRLMGTGQKDGRAFHLYAYSLELNSDKRVRSLRLPDNENALILAISLEPRE